jgi:DNA-binding response OmpR family regulator
MLLLTESNERRAMLEGSEPGTEDYLTKPFAIGELVERVEALGRRAPNSPAGCRFTLADLHLDLRQGRASRAGRDLELTRNEFRLLSIFMGEPGRIFSRAELSERLWRREHRYDSRSVEMLVSRLRKKVDTGFTPDLVHTFYSVGYSLAGR